MIVEKNQTFNTVAVPNDTNIGVKGFDTIIRESTNGVENKVFSLKYNEELSKINGLSNERADIVSEINDLPDSVNGIITNDELSTDESSIETDMSTYKSSVGTSSNNVSDVLATKQTDPFTGTGTVSVNGSSITDTYKACDPIYDIVSKRKGDDDLNPRAEDVREMNGFNAPSYTTSEWTGTSNPQLSFDYSSEFNLDDEEEVDYEMDGLLVNFKFADMIQKGSDSVGTDYSRTIYIKVSDEEHEYDSLESTLKWYKEGQLVDVTLGNIMSYFFKIERYCEYYNGSGTYQGIVRPDTYHYESSTRGDLSSSTIGYIYPTETIQIMWHRPYWIILPNQILAKCLIVCNSQPIGFGTLYSHNVFEFSEYVMCGDTPKDFLMLGISAPFWNPNNANDAFMSKNTCLINNNMLDSAYKNGTLFITDGYSSTPTKGTSNIEYKPSEQVRMWGPTTVYTAIGINSTRVQ